MNFTLPASNFSQPANWTELDELWLFIQRTSKRNIVISVITLVLWIIAVPIVIYAQFKTPVKVSLLNLAANNLCLVSIGILYAAVFQPVYLSENNHCQLICGIIVFNFLLMHISILGMSANNLVAVRYPYVYMSHVTVKVIAMVMVCAWFTTAAITIGLSYGRLVETLTNTHTHTRARDYTNMLHKDTPKYIANKHARAHTISLSLYVLHTYTTLLSHSFPQTHAHT